MNGLGYQIKKFRGCYLDVEFLLRTLTEIYGSQKVIAYLDKNIGELRWDDEDIDEANAILAKIKHEPEVPRPASQSSCAML
jgi:hypothetical protein